MYDIYYQSPVGLIKIMGSLDCISQIQFVEQEEKSNPNELLYRAVSQLEEYFSGQRISFDLPLEQSGTTFQQSVWKALTEVPFGETTTYGGIAKKLGNEKAVEQWELRMGRIKFRFSFHVTE